MYLQPLSRVQARWGCKTPAPQAAACSVAIPVSKALIYLKHLPPGAARLEPGLAGPTQGWALPAPWLAADLLGDGREAAPVACGHHRCHVWAGVSAALHRRVPPQTPEQPQQHSHREAERSFWVSPTAAGSVADQNKTEDLFEATQPPKTNIKLPSPQSIRKTVKTLTQV